MTRAMGYIILKYLAFFALVLVVASCSTFHKKKRDRELYERPLSPDYIRFVNFYVEGTSFYINYKSGSTDGYFSGDTEDLKRVKYNDTRLYGNRIIKLQTLDSDEVPPNVKSMKKINIVRSNEWEDYTFKYMEGLVNNLISSKKNVGIVISIQNDDYVIYKNENGEVVSDRLIKKPRNVVVEKYYNETDMYKIMIDHLRDEPTIKSRLSDGYILIETSSRTLRSSYILVDFNQEIFYYFDYDARYKFKKSGLTLKYVGQIVGYGVFGSHIVEPIKSPVTSITKLVSLVKSNIQKRFEDETPRVFDEIPPLDESGEMMDLVEFDRMLDDFVSEKKFKSSVDFLINGDQFFPDFFESVEAAQESIDIRLYIFDTDDFAVRVADILKDRSQDVSVRVMMDGLANVSKWREPPEIPFDDGFKRPSNIRRYMRYKGKVSSRSTANTWFIFDHSKMVIIDNELAYAGGMNIGQVYRYTWHDMMMKLRGPIVDEIQYEFTKAWTGTGGTGDLGRASVAMFHPARHSRPNSEKITDDMIDVRPLYTKPFKPQILEAQMLAIKNAKSRIYIQNPYLADYRIVNALIDARQRGVDVRIILPARNNVGIMSSSNATMTNVFIKNGIKVYYYPGMTHVKAAIYDGWACVGSANFDHLSLNVNLEFNIAFDDPAKVQELKEKLFDVDFDLSEEVTELVDIRWIDKFYTSIANRF